MAIIKICEIPDMNPFRFIRVDDPLKGYMTLHSDWYVNQQAEWNIKSDYYQKLNMDSYIGVQIMVGGNYLPQIISEGLYVLEILDCEGRIKGSVFPSSINYLPGNTRTYGGVSYKMATVNFQTSPAAHIEDPGVYFLRLKVMSEGVYDMWVSEPIDIRTNHEGTVLIEYVSYENKLGVDYSKIFFHLRVEGDIIYDAPLVNAIQYDDQEMNPRLQRATPYRSIVLRMGYPRGLPMWILDKVNRALSNDYVLIEKVRYVREGELSISGRQPRYLRYGASQTLREYDTDQSTVTTGAVPLPIIDLADMPLVAFQVKLTNVNVSVVAWEGYEVRNLQDAEAFVSAMNNYRAGGKLRGRFQVKDNKITYLNGENESYETNDSVVLTKSFSIAFLKAPSKNVNPYFTIGAARASVVFDRPDQVYNIGTPTGSAILFGGVTHQYTSSNPIARIYHDDTMTDLLIRPGGITNSAPTEAIYAGYIPTSLERFSVMYGSFTNGLDLTPFPNTLQQLTVMYSSIFFQQILGFNKNWVNLTLVQLSQNMISNVDAIFNAHYNSGSYVLPSGGVFITQGSAPPTNASLTARNALVSNGWTIIT